MAFKAFWKAKLVSFFFIPKSHVFIYFYNFPQPQRQGPATTEQQLRTSMLIMSKIINAHT
jgi:hypothetical protein